MRYWLVDETFDLASPLIDDLEAMLELFQETLCSRVEVFWHRFKLGRDEDAEPFDGDGENAAPVTGNTRDQIVQRVGVGVFEDSQLRREEVGVEPEVGRLDLTGEASEEEVGAASAAETSPAISDTSVSTPTLGRSRNLPGSCALTRTG